MNNYKPPKNSKDLPIEVFRKILYNGFYYKRKGEIYWESNAIFIGNGYRDHMIKTYPLGIPEFANGDGFATRDQHYWDWGRREDAWDFDDYGITWSVDEEDLK